MAEEIEKNDYVLSFNKYHVKEIEKKQYRASKEIADSVITNLKEEITQINEMRKMLGLEPLTSKDLFDDEK